MTNEEHRTKKDVEVDYGRNSVAPQPHFLFFLLLLTSLSQNLSMLNLGTLYSASLTPIYSKKGHLVDLQLTQVSCCLVQKKLAHPGELVPSALSNLGAQASQRHKDLSSYEPNPHPTIPLLEE